LFFLRKVTLKERRGIMPKKRWSRRDLANMSATMVVKEEKRVPLKEKLTDYEISVIQNYIKMMFPEKMYVGQENEKENDAYIVFRDRRDIYLRAIRVCDAYDIHLLEKDLNKMSSLDLEMTFNTFRDFKTTQSHMYSINCMVIDIDFKKIEGYTSWEQVLYWLEQDYFDKVIPKPTIIEHGNCMRLIYILEEPIYIAKKAKFRGFISTIQGRLTRKLSEFGGDCQLINSYVRLPGSINTKTNDKVEWLQYSNERLSLQDIVDEYVEKPSWYKTRQELKEQNLHHHAINWQLHNAKLLEDVVKLQAKYNAIEDFGHRENLCFLYKNYCVLNGYDCKVADQMTKEFNKNFNVPLNERKMLSSIRNVGRTDKTIYKYKFKTLKLMFEEVLDDTLYFNKPDFDRKAYYKAYYEKHRNKEASKTRVQKIKDFVCECKAKKKANWEIAILLLMKLGYKLSEKSIERYVTMLVKENRYQPKAA
jgi:hypothetical protein